MLDTRFISAARKPATHGQDAQINSLSILSTLVKQTTYLITLPDRSTASETFQKDET